MFIILLKFIVALAVVLVAVWAGTYSSSGLFFKEIIIFIATFLSVEITDKILFLSKRPNVHLKFTEDREGEIKVEISNKNKTVLESFNLKFDVMGEVCGIDDFDAKTHVSSLKKTSTGQSKNNISDCVQNTINVNILKFQGNKKLNLTIKYKPNIEKIEIGGGNVCTYNYSWVFKGESQLDERYLNIKTNKKVEKPGIVCMGVVFTRGSSRVADDGILVKEF